MPWTRWERRGTVGELLETARDSRGLSWAQAVTLLQRPEIQRVRRELNHQYHPPAQRRLALALTDQEIWDCGQRISYSILVEWERDKRPGEPDTLALAICASVYDYPIHFFYQTHPPQDPLVVHLKMSGNEPVCYVCGFLSEYLCDYPIGKGKTCDAPLCKQHAIEQGSAWADRQFCPVHANAGQQALPLHLEE